MNLRNVLRAFNAQRALTDDETALLNTLRSLNESERELLVESLSPGKVGKKKSVKGGKKSARASSLREQIQSTAKTLTNDGSDSTQLPTERCYACGNNAAFEDHFKPSPHYHPFASSSPARNAARGSSSKNGSPDESPVSSAAGKESVSSVTGG